MIRTSLCRGEKGKELLFTQTTEYITKDLKCPLHQRKESRVTGTKQKIFTRHNVMTLRSSFQQSENSWINVWRRILGCKRYELVKKGKLKLIIKYVMNNNILPKSGGSKFLKLLTVIYQTRRRLITLCHNIYIYHRDNLKCHKVSTVLTLGLMIVRPDVKMTCAMNLMLKMEIKR